MSLAPNDPKNGLPQDQGGHKPYLMMGTVYQTTGVQPTVFQNVDFNQMLWPQGASTPYGPLSSAMIASAIPNPLTGIRVLLPDGDPTNTSLGWAHAGEYNSGLYRVGAYDYGYNVNGALVTEWLTAEFRVNYLTAGQIVFPDANKKLTGSASLFWDNTNFFLQIQETTGKQLRLGYNSSHYVDFTVDTSSSFANTSFKITPTTQAFPNSFCSWRIQGSDFCLSYEGDEVPIGSLGVPNLTIRGPSSSGYAASSGPGLNFYNNKSALDSKCWSEYLNDTTLTYLLLNDAGNASTNWLTVTRSGITVSNIIFPQSSTPIGISSATTDFNFQIAGTASCTGTAGAAFASQNTIPSTCTARYSGWQANITTAAASFTLSDAFGVYFGAVTKGAGSSISRITGFVAYSGNVGIGSASAGFYYGLVAPSYTGDWAFYNATSTPCYFGTGNIQIGTNPATGGTVNLPNQGLIYFRNHLNSGDVQAISLDNNDNLLLGISSTTTVWIGRQGAQLGTTATGGFAGIPSCSGTPTGVPANIPTGQIPVIYDTSANKIWFYNGSWRGVLVT